MSRRSAVFEGIGLPNPIEIRPAVGGGLEKEELQLQRDRMNMQKQTQKQGNLSDTQKWIDDNFDPNKNLSGNPFADPTYNKSMADINAKAYQLASQGTDVATIKFLLGPDADKLHTYSTKAKAINENLGKQLEGVPNSSGYNKDQLRKLALRKAMLDEKGEIRSDIDEKGDYLGQVLSESPLEVTTNEGIQNFVKDSMVNAKPTVVETKTYNSKGGYEKKKLKITAPDWLVLDTDEKGNNTRDLVPKYEIATDDGEPINHTWDTKSGEVTAPVRLVDKKVFDMVLKSSPSYSDNLRGRVMQAISGMTDENEEPLSLNSPQAQNVARAFVYDDLKALSKGGVEDIVETKPTQVKNVTNVRVNNAKSDVPVIDVYTTIKEKADANKDRYAMVNNQKITGLLQANVLDDNEQAVVLEKAKKASGLPDIAVDDIYIRSLPDGVWIYRTEDNKPLTKLTQTGTNVTANQPLGTKSKQQAVKDAGDKEPQKVEYTNVQTLQDSKGKTIQAGVKGGKWYDIKTGKPIE